MESTGTSNKNKGGRPRKPVDIAAVLSSPEGQAAIMAAAESLKGQIIAQVVAEMGSVAHPGPAHTYNGPQGRDLDALTKIFGQMGLSFADIADQGTGRVRISPEEQSRRRDARERMGELLIEARQRGEMPEYELIAKMRINDELVEPLEDVDGVAMPVVVTWPGPPGPAMRPYNDIAKLIFEQYSISIGGISETADGQPAQPIWVTFGKGHAVRAVQTTPGSRFREGSSRSRAPQIGGIVDTGVHMRSPESGPKLAGRRAAQATQAEVRVMGTVAPPARSIVPGAPRQA